MTSSLPIPRSNPLASNVNEEMINSTTTEITRLSNRTSLLTGWRTRKFKNHMDLDAAKQKIETEKAMEVRLHKKAIEHTEDYYSKLMLAESQRKTTAIEDDILRTKNEADKDSIVDASNRELDAYAVESMRMATAQAMCACGQISERRYQQYLANTEVNTNELIQGVYRNVSEIKANRDRRFTATLQQQHRGT